MQKLSKKRKRDEGEGECDHEGEGGGRRVEHESEGEDGDENEGEIEVQKVSKSKPAKKAKTSKTKTQQPQKLWLEEKRKSKVIIYFELINALILNIKKQNEDTIVSVNQQIKEIKKKLNRKGQATMAELLKYLLLATTPFNSDVGNIVLEYSLLAPGTPMVGYCCWYTSSRDGVRASHDIAFARVEEAYYNPEATISSHLFQSRHVYYANEKVTLCGGSCGSNGSNGSSVTSDTNSSSTSSSSSSSNTSSSSSSDVPPSAATVGSADATSDTVGNGTVGTVDTVDTTPIIFNVFDQVPIINYVGRSLQVIDGTEEFQRRLRLAAAADPAVAASEGRILSRYYRDRRFRCGEQVKEVKSKKKNKSVNSRMTFGEQFDIVSPSKAIRWKSESGCIDRDDYTEGIYSAVDKDFFVHHWSWSPTSASTLHSNEACRTMADTE